MPRLRISVARLVVELTGTFLIAGAGVLVTAAGMLQWLGTILVAAYPCGETYGEHPACRLAHPEAVERAYRLMIAVPAECTLAGLLLATATFALWRHAVTPVLLGVLLGFAAYGTGQPMLDAALADRVPW